MHLGGQRVGDIVRAVFWDTRCGTSLRFKIEQLLLLSSTSWQNMSARRFGTRFAGTCYADQRSHLALPTPKYRCKYKL